MNRFHNNEIIPVGVEPTTSGLEGQRSTTELRDQNDLWSMWVSIPLPPPTQAYKLYKSGALPR